MVEKKTTEKKKKTPGKKPPKGASTSPGSPIDGGSELHTSTKVDRLFQLMSDFVKKADQDLEERRRLYQEKEEKLAKLREVEQKDLFEKQQALLENVNSAATNLASFTQNWPRTSPNRERSERFEPEFPNRLRTHTHVQPDDARENKQPNVPRNRASFQPYASPPQARGYAQRQVSGPGYDYRDPAMALLHYHAVVAQQDADRDRERERERVRNEIIQRSVNW